MRILTDFHHAGLLHSLIMLFEDRLGYELYRPIGMEWAEEGFWKVFDHPATQQQYLTLAQGYRPEDGTEPLNQVFHKVHPGIYYCHDIDSGFYNKAISLKGFKKLDFDIVIASLPQHIEPFKQLIKLHQPKAKLIFQVGNDWNMAETGQVDNVMASAIVPQELHDIANVVTYHQEFDLNLFNNHRIGTPNTIKSFMNCPEDFPDYPLLLDIETQMKDWDFTIHGAQSRDGPVHGAKEVADAIKSSQFVWHVKAGGDGYGHILFNSAACGVPSIVKKSYYAGKLGEKLLINRLTCIDIDGLTANEIVEQIKYWSEPNRYRQMTKDVYQNFKTYVDFNEDEIAVREFLKGLR